MGSLFRFALCLKIALRDRTALHDTGGPMRDQFGTTAARWIVAAVMVMSSIVGTASATPFFFSTGGVDGRMAAASRPDAGGKIEIEAADDFTTIASQTQITSATFTGLLTGAAPTIGEVAVEI